MCDSAECFYVIDPFLDSKLHLCTQIESADFWNHRQKKTSGQGNSCEHIKWLLVNKVQMQTDSRRISSHWRNSSRQGARKKKKKELAGNAAERLSGVVYSDFPEVWSEMQQDTKGGEKGRCSWRTETLREAIKKRNVGKMRELKQTARQAETAGRERRTDRINNTDSITEVWSCPVLMREKKKAMQRVTWFAKEFRLRFKEQNCWYKERVNLLRA